MVQNMAIHMWVHAKIMLQWFTTHFGSTVTAIQRAILCSVKTFLEYVDPRFFFIKQSSLRP
jgi:hypothetical protein